MRGAATSKAGTLRRKCGCAGACGSCREKRELRRSAIDPRTPDSIPRSVDRVLTSSGAPLDPSLRRAFEPRFGHDFSSVRVHTDADAATSARDVHARAWTVGGHIAFGAGHGPNDRALLAHELTHVVQQSSMPRASSLAIGAANDPAEAEADAVSAMVLRGVDVPIGTRTQPAVRRSILDQVVTFLRLHPAGREMTPDEITTAEAVTGTKAPATAAPGAGTAPVFVLHDTGGVVDDEKIKEQQGFVGPQGKGIQVWLPERREVEREDSVTKTKTKEIVAPDPEFARPFYELKRPSSSAFERGQDILSLDARARAFRAIWKATSTTEGEAAIDRVLTGNGFAPGKKMDAIKKATRVWFKGVETKVDGAGTTALWAVEDLCAKVSTEGAGAVAAPDAAKAKTPNADILDTRCAAVARLFRIRNERIAPIVGVEIVQPKDDLPLPNPPYLPKQYDDLAKLYILAALAALRWPKITTHREIDKVIKGGHGDPRCFNLHELYRLIAGKMKHDAATIYGIEPKYGKDGTPGINIAWTKEMCHGAAPK
jgi:hypothetical protein